MAAARPPAAAGAAEGSQGTACRPARTRESPAVAAACLGKSLHLRKAPRQLLLLGEGGLLHSWRKALLLLHSRGWEARLHAGRKGLRLLLWLLHEPLGHLRRKPHSWWHHARSTHSSPAKSKKILQDIVHIYVYASRHPTLHATHSCKRTLRHHIVFSTFVNISQYLIRLADFLEPTNCFTITWVLVGMRLERKLTIGPLNLFLSSLFRNSKYFVI